MRIKIKNNNRFCHILRIQTYHLRGIYFKTGEAFELGITLLPVGEITP